jgi:hypothetical protein
MTVNTEDEELEKADPKISWRNMAADALSQGARKARPTS